MTAAKDEMESMTDEADEDLLALNQTLLEAIAQNDYGKYSTMCSDDITCIEPESLGHVVRGIAFHRYFFDNAVAVQSRVNVIMTNSHVQRLGDNGAVISYTRINQRMDSNGNPVVTSCCETRVWQKKEDGTWWNVHFHRS